MITTDDSTFKGHFEYSYIKSQDFQKEEKSLNRNGTQRAHTDCQKDIPWKRWRIFPFQKLRNEDALSQILASMVNFIISKYVSGNLKGNEGAQSKKQSKYAWYV